jgi:hypothetical protein
MLVVVDGVLVLESIVNLNTLFIEPWITQQCGIGVDAQVLKTS